MQEHAFFRIWERYGYPKRILLLLAVQALADSLLVSLIYPIINHLSSGTRVNLVSSNVVTCLLLIGLSTVLRVIVANRISSYSGQLSGRVARDVMASVVFADINAKRDWIRNRELKKVIISDIDLALTANVPLTLNAAGGIIYSIFLIPQLVLTLKYLTLLLVLGFVLLYLILFIVQRKVLPLLGKRLSLAIQNDAIKLDTVNDIADTIAVNRLSDRLWVFSEDIGKESREIAARLLFFKEFPRIYIDGCIYGGIVIFAGVLSITDSDISISGAIALLLIAAQRLLPHINNTFKAWSGIVSYRPQAEAILLFISSTPLEHRISKDKRFHGGSNKKELTGGVVSWSDLRVVTSDRSKIVYCDGRLEIKPGLTTITGESGSGKTTLLRIMAGVEKGFSGTLSYLQKNGQPVSQRDLSIYYGQQFPVRLPVSLYKNIDICDEGEKGEFIDMLIASLGLESLRNSDLRCMSGGQLKRLEIARALASNAEIIFLDEPTSGLDFSSASNVRQIISDYAKDRVLICATHDNNLMAMSHRIFHVR